MKKKYLLIGLFLFILYISFIILTSDYKTQLNYIISSNNVKKVTIQAKRIELSTKVGFINNIYKEGENTLIKFDEVEFYSGKDAEKEYFKDKFYYSEDEFGHDYYIRNKEIKNAPYILSTNCSINICIFITNPNTNINSAELTTISEEDFKIYINKWSNISESNKELGSSRALLFSITTEDGIVTNINMKYTP